MNTQIKVGDKVRRKKVHQDRVWCEYASNRGLAPDVEITVESLVGTEIRFNEIGSFWFPHYFDRVPTPRKKKPVVVTAKAAPFKVGDCILIQDNKTKSFDSYKVFAVSDNGQAFAWYKNSYDGNFLWKNLKDHYKFIQVVR